MADFSVLFLHFRFAQGISYGGAYYFWRNIRLRLGHPGTCNADIEISSAPVTSTLELRQNMDSNQEIEVGSFAPTRLPIARGGPIQVVDWNIDRGLQLDGVIEFLASTKADLILLQEVDLNARRTQQRNIAREIAQRLRLNYIFGREFQELSQGSEISPAFHGQATLSPWPLSDPRILRFRRQSSFWRPRWFLPDFEPFQERLGGRIALVTIARIAGRAVVSYNLHLESRGDAALRCSQLDECLHDAQRYRLAVPIIFAGDFNLDVSRSSAATNAIRQAQFLNTASKQPARTTPPSSVFDRGRPIDWIFLRGSLSAAGLRVNDSVSASDHYPISVQVVLA